MARLTLEVVKEELIEYGISYVSGEYKNLESMLTVKCSEGHEFLINLKTARRDPRCPSCVITDEDIDADVEMMQDKPSKKLSKRILVLDNATKVSGYCIKENNKILTYGVKNATGSQVERMLELRHWLISMIKVWEIDVLGLEGVQYQKNAETLIVLAKLLGVLQTTGFELLKSDPYIKKAVEWKSYCGVKGKTRREQKEAAQTRVYNLYGLRVSQDVADAICLCDYVEHLDELDKVGWSM